MRSSCAVLGGTVMWIKRLNFCTIMESAGLELIFPVSPPQLYRLQNFFIFAGLESTELIIRIPSSEIRARTDLQNWLARLVEFTQRKQAIYGFFNNDYCGYAAGTAIRFCQMLGQPGKTIDPDRQMRLF